MVGSGLVVLVRAVLRRREREQVRWMMMRRRRTMIMTVIMTGRLAPTCASPENQVRNRRRGNQKSKLPPFQKRKKPPHPKCKKKTKNKIKQPDFTD